MVEEEQLKQIREQLIQQIESSFPEESKQSTIQEINSMNDEELINFLKQNNIIKESSENQCIFCSIVNKETPAFRIFENSSACAILELNPVSKAHTLIIPKEHISKPEDIPEEVKELAQKVAQKIKELYNPLKTDIAIRNVLGHEAINIIPVYNDETIDSPRTEANKQELEEMRKQLEQAMNEKEIKTEVKEIEEQKAPEPPREINEENTWLPRRLP